MQGWVTKVKGLRKKAHRQGQQYSDHQRERVEREVAEGKGG